MPRFNIMDNGYRYDKLIFWAAFALVVASVFIVSARNNFDFSNTKIYVECDHPMGCPNPLLNIENCQEQLRILFFIPLYTANDCKENCKEAWCTQEILQPGKYGTPPDPLIKYIPAIALTLVILALLANHLIHNRGKKFKVQLNLKPKTREKIKKFFNRVEVE